jgi:hypothetical protein
MTHNDMKTCCYLILVQLSSIVQKTYPKDMYLRLLISYILHARLNLKWKAIYEIETVLIESSEIRVMTAGTVFVNTIEDEMVETEIRKKEASGLDVISLMQFQKYFADFNERLSKAYRYYYDFWAQLASEKPIIEVIKALGTRINTTNDEIKKSFELLVEKNTSQVKTIMLYGNYLKLVVNDSEEAEKVINRANNIISTTQNTRGYMDENNQLKYSDATNLSIVVASGDQHSMGIIKTVNSETLRLFNFSADELKGCSIDIFMPKIYADHHDK